MSHVSPVVTRARGVPMHAVAINDRRPSFAQVAAWHSEKQWFRT
jgi:hypothetical protein